MSNLKIAINEFTLVVKCKHEHVTPVEAICIDENLDVHIMYEYAELGDLSHFVESNVDEI